MFAEKFDALMNIAEISNSQLGRDINMNSSHIGRLRSGTRPLPKKHEYLSAMCRYLARHIKKDYQIDALIKLTGVNSSILSSSESTAIYLECWLTGQENEIQDVSTRLASGISRNLAKGSNESDFSHRLSSYLYGNAGKRKAVEQFFLMVLQEEMPQTLLLFSDENMEWLYEDAAFAAKWTELFKKVIMKGNRVKIIHTISRDINEMIEALSKWIPIYMTLMIEPYFYPRLRDGIFQHTLFIAPDTAAISSTSVQQNTEGMLNLFITDKTAINALTAEYEQYFALCRPLMDIYTEKDNYRFQRIYEALVNTEGNAYYCSQLPPLFSLPEETVKELSAKGNDKDIYEKWQQSLALFKKNIQKNHLTIVLFNPQQTMQEHIDRLIQLEKKYDNLNLRFLNPLMDNTKLYVKENAGAVMIKSGTPNAYFVINERNIVSAFWDYLEKI